MIRDHHTALRAAGALALAALGPLAHAEPAVAPDSGNAAWILTSTALVLFMTLPGLALFWNLRRT